MKIQEQDTNNIYFTSDLHLFHKNIAKYAPASRGTPHSLGQMHEEMLDIWCSKVPEDAIVFILGDVSFASNPFDAERTVRWLQSAPGIKHLVTGNHDKSFMERFGYLLENEKVFQSIQPYLELDVAKQKICLFHYGCRVWNGSHHGSWQLYGHSHGSLPGIGKQMDVGWDSTEILTPGPISYADVKRIMDKREMVRVDHHVQSTGH